MDQIQRIIEETPSLSDLQREFYLTILQERKEQILDSSLERLMAIEQVEGQAISQQQF